VYRDHLVTCAAVQPLPAGELRQHPRAGDLRLRAAQAVARPLLVGKDKDISSSFFLCKYCTWFKPLLIKKLQWDSHCFTLKKRY
jgi:hypothetical protein